ncbi:MAG: hypothetical protein M3Y57_04825 [Acidobacteriota bacterium]|nr:hypothetical protein [Acidobacteriota bacterium]
MRALLPSRFRFVEVRGLVIQFGAKICNLEAPILALLLLIRHGQFEFGLLNPVVANTSGFVLVIRKERGKAILDYSSLNT